MTIICEICGGEIEFNGRDYKCTKCGENYGHNISFIDDDDYDEIDKPECCRACGGPYPDCMDSCAIFDD